MAETVWRKRTIYAVVLQQYLLRPDAGQSSGGITKHREKNTHKQYEKNW